VLGHHVAGVAGRQRNQIVQDAERLSSADGMEKTAGSGSCDPRTGRIEAAQIAPDAPAASPVAQATVDQNFAIFRCPIIVVDR